MTLTPVPLARRPLSVLALGFRPFFLAAGLLAVTALPAWLAVLRGWIAPDAYYGGTAWHAHAMLFGYGQAVIAGFLLTATRNWTGMATASGPALGGLAGLWLAGLAAPWLPLPRLLIAGLDLAFPLALAVALFKPLWAGPNPANRAFIGLLAGMAGASLLVHLDALGIARSAAPVGDRLMLGLILATLTLVAGRIMPFFTRAACPGADPRVRPSVERLTFGLTALWVAADTIVAGSAVAGAAALALAGVHAVRLGGWHDRRAWKNPMLAVLYSGYLWLILGLVLNGLAHRKQVAPFPALHALSVGAVGVFTLGMMVRVTLGHTGREMRATRATVAAFVALNLAALVRAVFPLLWPARYTDWLTLSGLLWTLAFALFLWVCAPMLVRPRVDGQPG